MPFLVVYAIIEVFASVGRNGILRPQVAQLMRVFTSYGKEMAFPAMLLGRLGWLADWLFGWERMSDIVEGAIPN